MSAQLTRRAAKNDANGVTHTVTVAIGNGALVQSGQFNDILISYVQADGTSVEADVALPGFTPYNGQE